MNEASDVLALVAAVFYTLIALLYGYAYRWSSSWPGRLHLMLFVVLGNIFWFNTASIQFGLQFKDREFWRIATYVFAVAVAVAYIGVLFRHRKPLPQSDSPSDRPVHADD